MSEENFNIAIVEDDLDQAHRIGDWLSDRGHKCTTFENSNEFQQAFGGQNNFDVVTLDWTLPGETGIDVLNWLRHSQGSTVPVMFLSARQAESDIVLAMESGANDYLAKPARRQELVARVEALAKQSKLEKTTSGSQWVNVKEHASVQQLISELTPVLNEILMRHRGDNRIGDERTLGELEEAQLIAILKTSLSVLDSPMIEKSLLKKASHELKKAAEKSAEKKVQEGVRDLYQVAVKKIGEIISEIPWPF